MQEPFLTHPNLPEDQVTLCAVSSEDQNIIQRLEQLGIKCILVTPHPHLQLPVASHADMQVLHLGGKQIICAEENKKLRAAMKAEGFQEYAVERLEPAYPADSKLNAARIGTHYFGNQKGIGKTVLRFCKAQDIPFIHTAQGYTKCSICVVNKTALITADYSIAKAARTAGMDVLLISQGNIAIKEYNYGFIGGCCGKLGPDCIAFTGDISAHPDYQLIKSFLQERHIDIICLSNQKLKDIGGILPLKERGK